MFGSIGGPEILFVFVLALLLFGPRRLPEIGRTIGKTLSEFRRATYDFRSGLEREIELEKVQDSTREVRSAAGEAARIARDPGSVLRELDQGGTGSADDRRTSD